MHGRSPVSVEVLGPTRLIVGDTAVPLGSPKLRALLQRLVVSRDRAVGNDELLRSLWGDRPPRTAEHALQVHASKLRSLVRDAGGALPIEAGAGTYRLATDPLLRVDVYDFEHDLADGRAALVARDAEHAAAALLRARERWRGPAFPDLSDDVVLDPAVVDERRRLDTLRMDADEEWADACLALGRHHELVPVLEAAVREAPLRERRHQQLMVALYAAGRAPEALDVYQRARRDLVDELGIEPGPLLRATEAAVLNHDLSQLPGIVGQIASPSAPTAHRPSRRFVGRFAEWSRLHEIVAGAARGAGRVALVAGPPGIGKTRLLEEVAAAAGPMRVARGASPETGAAPPLWPIVEALRDLGPNSLPELGTGLDDEILAPLRSAVLGTSTPMISRPTGPDDGAAFRIDDAVADLLIRIARRAPLLLVLDDLHTVDAATARVLGRIADRIADEPLAVLGTHRDTPGDHTPAFTSAAARLARSPNAETLTLGPLGPDDVAGYLDAVGLGDLDIAAQVHRRCDGSPLLLTELVGLLLDHGGDPDALERLPDSLTAVIEARLDQLGTARTVLERAAVIGSSFSVDHLARIADTGTDQLLDGLHTALRFGVVDEPTPGRYRFRHALVAETAARALSPSERTRLHLRTAEVLERAGPGTVDRSVAVTEAARHRVAALPGGDPAAAAAACLAAAELTSAAIADTDTAWFAAAAGRALDLAGATDPVARTRALVLEGESRTMSGEDARTLLDAAVAEARRTGDPELFGHAVRVLSLNRSTAASAGAPEMVALLEEAITALGDRGDWLTTQLSVDLAMTLYRTPVHPRPRELCEAALHRARTSGDPVSVAFALTGLHQAIWESRTARRRADVADEAIVAAATAGLAWHESMATSFRGVDRWELGDLDGAAADFDHALELAHRGRRARFVWIAQSWRALVAAYRGDRHTADHCRATALAAWGPEPNPDAVLCDLAQHLMWALLDERTDEIVPIARFQAGTDAEPLFWTSLLALATSIDASSDDPGSRSALRQSRSAIDEVLAAGLDTLLPTVTRLPALVFLAEAAARTGHTDAAGAVGSLLEPEAGSHVVLNVYGGGGICWGVVDQALALTSTTLGDHEAATHWQRSAERHLAASGGVTFLERCRRLAGVLSALTRGS